MNLARKISICPVRPSISGPDSSQAMTLGGRDGRIRTADFLLPKQKPRASQSPHNFKTYLNSSVLALQILADYPHFGKFWREFLTQILTQKWQLRSLSLIFIPRRATMPYKDPDKRRTYQREYKRCQRSGKKMSNLRCQTLSTPAKTCLTSSQTVKRKAYICPKVPHYRLPGIAFKNGIFVTDRSEEQERIESDPLYGEDIFSWVLEP
jgi:hypothetical protein